MTKKTKFLTERQFPRTKYEKDFECEVAYRGFEFLGYNENPEVGETIYKLSKHGIEIEFKVNYKDPKWSALMRANDVFTRFELKESSIQTKLEEQREKERGNLVPIKLKRREEN